MARHIEVGSKRVRIPSQHGLNPMTSDLGEVSIVHAGGAKVRDVAVPALLGADVYLGREARRMPRHSEERARQDLNL
jgi:hypothetical protein